jgi:deoxyribodipyrimidine photo-lyase
LINSKKYNETINTLSIDTTKIGAYIKFGCVSIREVYHCIKDNLGTKNDLIKQLYWREFYYRLSNEYPRVFSFDWNIKNIKIKYSKIPWFTITDSYEIKERWKAWCHGLTGFPIVDASMRQLNRTGFMHNRSRLIVASFLVKNLFIHWAEGEKYFSQKLIDIDPMNNTQNWLWISGAGADSQPYFRLFNPWLQSKKYDPNCEFIKRWIPELEIVPNNHIHKWYLFYYRYDVKYPRPIIDYYSTSKKNIKIYRKFLNKN